MSVKVKFKIGNKKGITANYTVKNDNPIRTVFRIGAASTAFSALKGSPYDNANLKEALDLKADKSELDADIAAVDEAISNVQTVVENNYNTLDTKIDNVNSDLSRDISTLENTVNSNNTAVNNRIDVTNRNVSNLSTTVANNNTAINTRVDGIVNSFDGDISALETAIQNEATTRANKDTLLQGDINTLRNDLTSEISNRTSADNTLQDNIDNIQNTINNYGDIVSYNASDFATSAQGALANTALQPGANISRLTNNVGYITASALNGYATQLWVTDRGYITGINNTDVVTALGYTPYNSTNPNGYITSADLPTLENLTTTEQLNAINSGATVLKIEQIATNEQNISNLQTTVTNNYNTLDNRITSETSTLNTAIGAEATNRQNADNALQSQIDALVVSSDVFDIVGTYAELQAYDISSVPVNDIIKVLVDSTHNNAATYYRCVESNNVKSWTYIGSEGAYYTKSEADNTFVAKTTTINNKPLSNNITLTANDVNALPADTIIGSGVITLQKNGVNIDSFNVNATANKSINISVPTDTGDLTNNAGFITGITSSDVTTALGYTPYNASNPNGYTSNIGTVTSVNNIQPDANGNVGINIPTITVDQTFDGTSQNAQSGIAIYGALTDGSISPTFGDSIDISSANLYFDSDNYVLYSSAKTDFPEISINSSYDFKTETNAETGENELLIYSNITDDNIWFSSEGGILIDTSSSGGQLQYNGNEVATLSDIPSIPTVNNGTLTIQKNGTTIGTFTANQSGNSTVNIEADTVLTDDITVSKNSNDELQAIGVIDNNSGSAIKYWTGTQAEYNDLKKILIWTPAVENTDLSDNNWYALAYDGTKFVALGKNGYISTSTDGTTWTPAIENTNLDYNNWMALAYDGTKFVALGRRGYISTSTNGTTWTSATQDTNLIFNNWHALAYDGTKFVALDIYGAISTSTDGTTWTPIVESTNLGNHNWMAISYDGTKFVALGLNGYISTSTDGTTWTSATQDANLIYGNNWYALAYDGTKFVALDLNGYISTSIDGTTWTSAVQNTNLGSNRWQSLAFDGEKFVALGATGYTSIGQSSIDEYTTYVCTDTKNIYKGSISLSANTDLSNLSSTGQAVIDSKVSKSDIWYDSSTSTLYIGVPQS